jgi:hypothetical protein
MPEGMPEGYAPRAILMDLEPGTMDGYLSLGDIIWGIYLLMRI